jgi:hypothetical protein
MAMELSDMMLQLTKFQSFRSEFTAIGRAGVFSYEDSMDKEV